MRTIITKNYAKILKNRKKLEAKLRVKIENKGAKITLKGKEIDEYTASQVIEALDANFPIDIAMMLTEEENMLEHLNIKDISRRKTNLKEVRARVIGTQGRTIDLIGELSDTYIKLNDNQVSVIGPADKMEIALHALHSLIKGSKQSSVYAYLEKQRKRYFEDKVELREQKE